MRKFSSRQLRLAVLVISGCGREAGSELELHELGVIPSKVDSGIPDAGNVCLPSKPADAGWLVIPGSCSNEVTTRHHGVVRFNDVCRHEGAICDEYCGGIWNYGCHLLESEPSEVVCWQGCVGRLIDGAQPRFDGEGLGGALANMAAHEGAAAFAFAELAREVEAHGLSSQLVNAAKRAAVEEVRHTQLVGTLAHARGGRFEVRVNRRHEARSLEEIALENAVEGCVRETLGAMVGLYQSQHAHDARVREVMKIVSADELGHAAWSHALAETLESRLPLSARRRVRSAREESLQTAAKELATAVEARHVAALGFPDEERLQSLARALM